LGAEILKSLEKVTIGRGAVFIFGVEDTALEVEGGLEEGWAVDQVGRGAGGCESCPEGGVVSVGAMKGGGEVKEWEKEGREGR
jgi:hypothetical protein